MATKSIKDMLVELEKNSEDAKFILKLAEQYVKHEFGYTTKEVHQIIERQKLYESKKRERQMS